MLRASLVFFVIGLFAIALGVNGVAGVSLDIGRLLLFVFLGLSILSFLAALLTGRTPKTPALFVAGMIASAFGALSLTTSPRMAYADESAATASVTPPTK